MIFAVLTFALPSAQSREAVGPYPAVAPAVAAVTWLPRGVALANILHESRSVLLQSTPAIAMIAFPPFQLIISSPSFQGRNDERDMLQRAYNVLSSDSGVRNWFTRNWGTDIFGSVVNVLQRWVRMV